MEPAMVAAGAWCLSRLNFPAQVVQRAPGSGRSTRAGDGSRPGVGFARRRTSGRTEQDWLSAWGGRRGNEAGSAGFV